MTPSFTSVGQKSIVSLVSIAIAVALTVVPHAFAQQRSTNVATPALQMEKSPDATKASQDVGSSVLQKGPQQLRLIATPWTKYCARDLTAESSEIKAKEVCFTASDAHVASGEKIAIALLIEPTEGDTKLLRVTLPLGVALVPGARIVIDEKEALIAPYEVCDAKTGCMANYKADAALIAKLKAGSTLAIQAFDKSRPISFTLPLGDFAKAYDGPARDPLSLDEPQASSQSRGDLGLQ